MQKIRDRLSVRISARANDRRQRRETLGPPKERRMFGSARCVRQQLANGRVRFLRRNIKRADTIVQRQATVFGAPQDHGGGKRLRQAISIERCVGADRQRASNVLLAVSAFPDDPTVIDNSGGQAGDTSLVAQRIKVGPEDFVDDDLRLRRHANEEHRGDQGGEKTTTHYSPRLYRNFRGSESAISTAS